MKTSSKILAGVVIVAVIGIFLYWYEDNSTPSNTVAETNTTDTNNTNTQTASNDSNKYKDGTYDVVTGYISPGGKDSLGVSLTLSSGKISKVNVKNMAGDPTSNNYQNRFISSISSVVVGQPIANLKVSVVSGASLATGAFNQALSQIRSQAMTN